MLHGTAVSEGIGLGRVMLLEECSLVYREERTNGAQAERERFRQAAEAYRRKTQAQMEHLKRSAGEEDAQILEAHMAMSGDPSLLRRVGERIDQGKSAEAALQEVCRGYIEVFSASSDELTRRRAEDVRELCRAIQRELLGVEEADVRHAPKGTVLVARELSAAVMAGIDNENIAGIVTEGGGMTSHSSILARAMGVPAVCGVKGAVSRLADGAFVIVDGTRGDVIFTPKPEEIEAYQKRQDAFLEKRRRVQYFLHKKTQAKSGEEFKLLCNISMPSGAARALEAGGEGVGLFRTEYLFMNRQHPPCEEEQYQAYAQTLRDLKGRPLTIRTLDVGGDKEAACLELAQEANPFLGLRGIRWCLKNREVFLTQLRALLRAGVLGDLRVMLPMVSTLEELREARVLLDQARSQLKAQGLPCVGNLPVGIMIETPAAVLTAAALAREADFFSIGTNDLVGYVMACDRGSPQVSGLYSPMQPAVLHALREVIRLGRERNIPVSLCGEAAADPRLTPLLISFGLSGFSVAAASVLAVRAAVARWTKGAADQVAEAALAMGTEAEVQAYLRQVAVEA